MKSLRFAIALCRKSRLCSFFSCLCFHTFVFADQWNITTWDAEGQRGNIKITVPSVIQRESSAWYHEAVFSRILDKETGTLEQMQRIVMRSVIDLGGHYSACYDIFTADDNSSKEDCLVQNKSPLLEKTPTLLILVIFFRAAHLDFGEKSKALLSRAGRLSYFFDGFVGFGRMNIQLSEDERVVFLKMGGNIFALPYSESGVFSNLSIHQSGLFDEEKLFLNEKKYSYFSAVILLLGMGGIAVSVNGLQALAVAVPCITYVVGSVIGVNWFYIQKEMSEISNSETELTSILEKVGAFNECQKLCFFDLLIH